MPKTTAEAITIASRVCGPAIVATEHCTVTQVMLRWQGVRQVWYGLAPFEEDASDGEVCAAVENALRGMRDADEGRLTLCATLRIQDVLHRVVLVDHDAQVFGVRREEARRGVPLPEVGTLANYNGRDYRVTEVRGGQPDPRHEATLVPVTA